MTLHCLVHPLAESRRAKPGLLKLALLGLSLSFIVACHSSSDSNTPSATAPTAPTPPETVETINRFQLANRCFVTQSVKSGKFLSLNDRSPAFSASAAAFATPFFFKPSALGRYLIYSPGGQWLSLLPAGEDNAQPLDVISQEPGTVIEHIGDVVSVIGPMADPVDAALGTLGEAVGAGALQLTDGIRGDGTIAMSDTPIDGSEWDIFETATGYTLISTHTGEHFSELVGDNELGTEFVFVPAENCLDYPEAELNASGEAFKGTLPDGTVFGYAETHMHLGGSEALGGRIGYGKPFHRFGIIEALKDCAEDHGQNGSEGILDVAVDPQTSVPFHETQGWPTFNAWPTHHSQTHHQTYYMWLKRAWMGGLRFMVNHLVANEMLCVAWPRSKYDCNEMESARLQLTLVEGLQDYIDAQEGGPGEGFFRIVHTPEQARTVIESGKMAVINGIELEKPFDCGEYLDSPECSQEEINERIDEWYAMGLRAVFPIHIFDNAIGGAEISRFTRDAALIQVYNGGNIVETGHPYATIPCEEADAVAPDEAPQADDRDLFGMVALQLQNPPPTPLEFSGCINNARGLTSTGAYFIEALIKRGMFIEVDHSGPLARKAMLDIAKANGVPVVSGHTGSITFARDSKRILATGGIISNLSDDPAPVTIEFIQDLEAAYNEVFGSTDGLATGFGSDINGIHKQPKPRDDAAANPLSYPFTSFDGNVTFTRQTTGERQFDLNTDGVAHYGLYPDYIADIQAQAGGEDALKYLFRSAEAYLQAWETIHAKRPAQ